MSKLQLILRCLLLAAVAALGWTLGEFFHDPEDSPSRLESSPRPPSIPPQAQWLAQITQNGSWVFQGQPWEVTSVDVSRADLEKKLAEAPVVWSTEDVDTRTESLIFDILKSFEPQVRLEGNILHYIARKSGHVIHAFVGPEEGKPRLHVLRFAAEDVTPVTRLVEVRPRARAAVTTRSAEPRLDLDCPVMLSRLDDRGTRVFDILECAGGIDAMVPRWRADGWQVETPDWAPKDQNYHLCRKGDTGYLAWEAQAPGQERAGVFVSRVP